MGSTKPKSYFSGEQQPLYLSRLNQLAKKRGKRKLSAFSNVCRRRWDDDEHASLPGAVERQAPLWTAGLQKVG